METEASDKNGAEEDEDDDLQKFNEENYDLENINENQVTFNLTKFKKTLSFTLITTSNTSTKIM